MEADQPMIRRRINVTRLAKGGYSFEFTVEIVQPLPTTETEAQSQRSFLLLETTALRIELEARYPMEKP